jgi:hypothetical protein
MRGMNGYSSMTNATSWIEVVRTFTIILVITVCSISDTLASEERGFKEQYDWVVQVLTYRNDELINQGSGFVIGDPPVIATASHLLEKGDAWFIVLSDGTKKSAKIRDKHKASDIAVLDVQGDLPNAPELASRNLRRGDSARIYGYWIDGLEKKREAGILGIFKDTLPQYVADQVLSQRQAITVIQDASEDSLNYIAQTGRGAYGSAVVNQCGEIAAFFGSPKGKTLDELWSRVKIDAKRSALLANNISGILSSLGVNSNTAGTVCLEESELALLEKEKAEKKVKQEQNKVKKAQQEAEQERKKAKEAEERVEQAQKEKDREKEEKTVVVEQMAEELKDDAEERSALVSMLEKYQTYLIVGAILAALVFSILILTLRKRKRALGESQQELMQMNSPRTNYIFSGSDSQGNPIGLKVLGSDLYKSQGGLLLGRNPNSVQLVVADETVSRVHAKLFINADQLYIEDYGSTSGTTVDNIRVEPSHHLEVRHGASVQLGDVVLEVRYEEPL